MERFFSRVGRIGAGMLATGIVFSRFIFVVDGGERGVVFDRFRGVVDKVYGEGMHFIIPFIQVSLALYFMGFYYHSVVKTNMKTLIVIYCFIDSKYF